MTDIEKEKIRYLRGEGLGYKAIASRLSLSENAVKGFCKRNNLDGVATESADNVCRQCAKTIAQQPGRKPRKFCSGECSRTWWSTHAHVISKRANYEITCAHCGRVFTSYGNKGRKYCGHPCYIAARFGGERL